MDFRNIYILFFNSEPFNFYYVKLLTLSVKCSIGDINCATIVFLKSVYTSNGSFHFWVSLLSIYSILHCTSGKAGPALKIQICC